MFRQNIAIKYYQYLRGKTSYISRFDAMSVIRYIHCPRLWLSVNVVIRF